jgi:hypothetical protein
MKAEDHEALARELQRAHTERNFDSAALRAAARQMATNARDDGTPPERLLVELKALFDDGALRGLSDWWRSIMTDRIVRWSIEAYYDVSITGKGPRHP